MEVDWRLHHVPSLHSSKLVKHSALNWTNNVCLVFPSWSKCHDFDRNKNSSSVSHDRSRTKASGQTEIVMSLNPWCTVNAAEPLTGDKWTAHQTTSSGCSQRSKFNHRDKNQRSITSSLDKKKMFFLKKFMDYCRNKVLMTLTVCVYL